MSLRTFSDYVYPPFSFFQVRTRTTLTHRKEDFMTNEARQARNAYQRKWRRENPEKFQAQIDRYWQKKADKMKAESAEPDKKKEEN